VYTEGYVGGNMSDFTLLCRDGTPIPADTAILMLVSLLTPLYSSDVTFVEAGLWKYRPGTGEEDWYCSQVVDELGEATPPYKAADEVIWTFRTQGNHLMRFTMEETVTGGNTRTAQSLLTGDWAALRDYIISGDNWIRARDGTYPIVPLYICRGQNEAIWRKRFRS